MTPKPKTGEVKLTNQDRCARCGKAVEWVGSGPEWMNSEQWDAVKAGDYFASCEHATHPNGNCYFRRGEPALALKGASHD